jgi:hypothetical protein
VPSQGMLIFRIITVKPEMKLSKVKEVMSVIASYNPTNWPDDNTWDLQLPRWFVNKIKSYSLEEINQSGHLLWDYGSWLDAMKFRGWEWFSSKVDHNGFLIYLKAIDFPFSVNPLEYVIYESGVPLSDINFEG